MNENLHKDERARELLEKIIWPEGIVCPHCQCRKIYKIKPKSNSRFPARRGLHKCAGCRKQFTATTGTIFKSTHLSDSALVASILNPKINANQLSRQLKITYKAARHTKRRIKSLKFQCEGMPSEFTLENPKPRKLICRQPTRPKYERPEIPNERETEISMLVNNPAIKSLDAPVYESETGHSFYAGEGLSPLEILLLKEEMQSVEFREKQKRIEDFKRFESRKMSAFQETYFG